MRPQGEACTELQYSVKWNRTVGGAWLEHKMFVTHWPEGKTISEFGALLEH